MNSIEKLLIALTACFFTFLISVGVGSYKEGERFNEQCTKLGGKYFKVKYDRLCIKQENILEIK